MVIDLNEKLRSYLVNKKLVSFKFSQEEYCYCYYCVINTKTEK